MAAVLSLCYRERRLTAAYTCNMHLSAVCICR